MSLIVKLIISLVIATIAYTLASLLHTGTVQLDHSDFGLLLLLAFFFATTATALLVRDSTPKASPSAGGGKSKVFTGGPSTDTGTREQGKVKWFNISKGFGFIVKDDGEEIFVHFRSIRGEGRRGLTDGQRVNFIVAESDKGPQAEDVVPED